MQEDVRNSRQIFKFFMLLPSMKSFLYMPSGMLVDADFSKLFSEHQTHSSFQVKEISKDAK